MSAENIQKIIIKKTPVFITDWITAAIDQLEKWRGDETINKIVFYVALGLALFFILRFIWKKIF